MMDELTRQVRAVLTNQTPADEVGWSVNRVQQPDGLYSVELVACASPDKFGILVWVFGPPGEVGKNARCKWFTGWPDGTGHPTAWIDDAIAFFDDAVKRPAAEFAAMNP
jgi:hypothetical protein